MKSKVTFWGFGVRQDESKIDLQIPRIGVHFMRNQQGILLIDWIKIEDMTQTPYHLAQEYTHKNHKHCSSDLILHKLIKHTRMNKREASKNHNSLFLFNYCNFNIGTGCERKHTKVAMLNTCYPASVFVIYSI